jgi:hypothetical protein
VHVLLREEREDGGLDFAAADAGLAASSEGDAPAGARAPSSPGVESPAAEPGIVEVIHYF